MKQPLNYTTKCVLALLLVIGFFVCVTSPYFKKFPSKGPIVSDEIHGETKKLTPPISAFLPIAHRPLIVYVEKEQIPQSWLDAFERQTSEKIEQRPLILGEDQTMPLDGDVYSLEPRRLGALSEKQELLPFENYEFWNGTNPIFGGHSFDVDNRWTRPWRWTPYFFYLRNPNANAQPNTPTKPLPNPPDKWWLATNALWPDDLKLLTALRMKELGLSANTKHGDLWEGTHRDLSKAINGSHCADEKTCWESLQEGKADISFLPATWRFKATLTAQQNFFWRAPSRGTLIRFDVLAISARTTQPDMAKKLVQFLTASEQQEKLLSDTGYLPVKSRPGHEWKATQLPAPTGDWLARSEFLSTPSLPAARKESTP